MAQIQRQKTSVLSVSLPKSVSINAKKFAKQEDISVSQLVTKALKSYIFAQEWENLRKAFRPLAKKLNIKTDEDVERIFG
jgi:metal-responsive CopG/Arc/MetJ family transcriptional regulator